MVSPPEEDVVVVRLDCSYSCSCVELLFVFVVGTGGVCVGRHLRVLFIYCIFVEEESMLIVDC